MPRKQKEKQNQKQNEKQNEKKNEKQNEKQSQNVKQTVIVRLDKEVRRKRRAYKRKAKQPEQPQYIERSQLPPNVIYQSSQIAAVPFTPEPVPRIMDTVPRPRPLEDTGIVGTEGKGVRILELPTKKEALAMMETPVPLTKKQAEQKMQSIENRIMGIEDAQSTKLGSSDYNFTAPGPPADVRPLTANLSMKQPSFTGPSDMPAPFIPTEQQHQQLMKDLSAKQQEFAGMKEPMNQKQDLSAYQDMSKPAPYNPTPPVNDQVLSKMYDKYGPSLEEEQLKREQKKARRNELARQRYAKKKAEKQMEP